MIINANGTLRAKVLTASEEDLDSSGYPVKSDDNWGKPIGCNIKTNNQASIGITTNGNVFETSAYEVLIEQQPFTAEVVKLVRDGVDLGEFQIQGEPEQLNHIGNTKILVKCLSNV